MLIIDKYGSMLLSWATFIFAKSEKTGDLYFYKSVVLSRFQNGCFVPPQNRRFYLASLNFLSTDRLLFVKK